MGRGLSVTIKGQEEGDDGIVYIFTAVVTQTYNTRLEPCPFPDFSAVE